jgi:pimeloyl-ACP methyl ester carboxylesterase
VVLLHGYGSERTQMLARAGLLQARGFAVLLYDARGHGQSGGDRVSFGWIERRDLTGALDYLRKRGFHEFGCIGASQGGATIVLAAPELRDVRWVVLESVYPTLIDAVDCRFRHSFGLPGWLLGCVMTPLAAQRLGVSCDAIAPLDHIRELPCPVLIMHGDADRHTLIASARAMFSRAAEPKSLWIVPGAAHIDLYGFAPDAYAKQLFGFLDRNQIR